MELTLATEGDTPSITSAFVALSDPAEAPIGTVSVAELPARSRIVPPFKANAVVDWRSRSPEVWDAATVYENVRVETGVPVEPE